MLLEPTANRDTEPGSPRISRRHVVMLGLGGTLLPILASCSQGTASESKRGQQRDTERTSVVDSMQATNSANLLGSPEPDSSPEE